MVDWQQIIIENGNGVERPQLASRRNLVGDSVQRVRGTVRRAVAAPVAIAQSRHTPPPPAGASPTLSCRWQPWRGSRCWRRHARSACGRSAFVRRRSPTLLQSSVQCLAQQKQLVAVIRLPDDCQHVPFIFLKYFWYCSDHFCDDSQKEVISLLLLLLLLQPQFSFQF